MAVASGPKIAFLEPPYRGMSDYPMPGYGPTVTNMIPLPGTRMIRKRGPFGYLSNNASFKPTSAQSATGIWAFDDKVLISWGLTGFNRIAPWQALTTVGTPDTPYVAADGIKHMSFANGAFPDVTTNLNNVATARGLGPRHLRYGNYVYGNSYNYTGTTTYGSRSIPKTFLLRWDGTAAIPTQYANAPVGIQDVAVHYNRLFVAAVTIAGDTESPNRLYYSDLVDPTVALPDTAAAWQDDVSGLTNKIIVGQDDGGDAIIGLAPINGNLLILKQHSIWILLGNAPANWTLRRLTNNRGCIDPNSILVLGDRVIFASQFGVFMYDGGSFIDLSAHVRETIVGYWNRWYDGEWKMVSINDIGNDVISVAVTKVDSGSYETWLCHLPTLFWSQLSTVGSTSTLMQVVDLGTLWGQVGFGSAYCTQIRELTGGNDGFRGHRYDDAYGSSFYTCAAQAHSWPVDLGQGNAIKLQRLRSNDYYISSVDTLPDSDSISSSSGSLAWCLNTTTAALGTGAGTTVMSLQDTYTTSQPGTSQRAVFTEVPTGVVQLVFYDSYNLAAMGDGTSYHLYQLAGLTVEYQIAGQRH